MHQYSIHKKLAECIAKYDRVKSTFFSYQGAEGRERLLEYKRLLKAFECGSEKDLTAIYVFYLNQNERSVLRKLIKNALCDILDIPYDNGDDFMTRYYNPYTSEEKILEMIQDRKLNDALYDLVHEKQYIELELQPMSNKRV